MIKKILGRAALWLIGLIALSIWTIYTNHLLGVGIAVVWFLVPFVSFLFNMTVRNHISSWINVPSVIAKNKKTFVEFIFRNDSILSVSKVFCKLKITNRMTNCVTTSIISFSAAAKEETGTKFEILSNQCGYLNLEIENCWLMDWFGFLPVKCREKITAKASVLPDTFVPGIVLSLSSVVKDDAIHWSQTQKGDDMTEVFGIRDYVPGDSFKQIHWKLSSKKHQLIVREPSLPVEKSLLIFWDKNTREATGKEMDALAECFVSVCQEIMNQGICFTAGWTEEKVCVFEDIETDDQLLAAIPRMIKHGADLSGGSGALIHSQERGYGPYGKVIYVAGTYPDDFEPFSNGELSLILCGKEQVETDIPAVLFDADHYEEDLEMIEL